MAIDFSALLTYQLWGNTGQHYLTVIITTLAGVLLLKIFKNIILLRLKQVASKTKTDIDDLMVGLLSELNWPLYGLISAYIALQTLNRPAIVDRAFHYLLVLGITFYIAKMLSRLLDYTVSKIIATREKNAQLQEASTIRLIGRGGKGVVWGVAILTALSNLGYNITTLVAGLGIGGIAVAFALQNILGDIFSSISLYFDKPFEIGDFIIVGEHMGIVKKIGMKSTRITALQGEEIVISNRELTTVRIQNFKKMEKRRVTFTLDLIYDTSNEKIRKALSIVQDVIAKAELADLDRVHFKQFGPHSLVFEIVYYLKTSEYNAYMDTQQEINLGIKERFEKEKIEFAYPTQTVVLAASPPKKKASPA